VSLERDIVAGFSGLYSTGVFNVDFQLNLSEATCPTVESGASMDGNLDDQAPEPHKIFLSAWAEMEGSNFFATRHRELRISKHQ
jgi:hypothetical protein